MKVSKETLKRLINKAGLSAEHAEGEAGVWYFQVPLAFIPTEPFVLNITC
jgi:hypothetical protein